MDGSLNGGFLMKSEATIVFEKIHLAVLRRGHTTAAFYHPLLSAVSL